MRQFVVVFIAAAALAFGGRVIRPAVTSPPLSAPRLSLSTRWFDTLDLSQQRDSLVAAALRQAGGIGGMLLAVIETLHAPTALAARGAVRGHLLPMCAVGEVTERPMVAKRLQEVLADRGVV